MKLAGLVGEVWVRRGRKNVKEYHLKTGRLEIEFGRQGLTLRPKSKKGSTRKYGRPPAQTLDFLSADIPEVGLFVGRRKELALLDSPGNFTIVWGLPGIGKTSLVAKYARSLSNTRPVFWHDIREVDTLNHLITKVAVFLAGIGRGALLELLESETDDERLRIDATMTELETSNTLVILDDYQYCQDPRLRRFIEDLAKARRAIRTILLSRDLPAELLVAEQGVRDFRVDGLSEEEVKPLLTTAGQRLSTTRPRVEQGASVADASGISPLLVRISLASSRSQYPKVVDFESLRKPPKLLEDYLATELLEQLSEDERTLVETISVFREPVPFEAFKLLAPNTGGLPRILQRFERKGILVRIGDMLAIHDLVRVVCYRRMDSPELYHAKAAIYYIENADFRSMVECLYHSVRAKDYGTTRKIIAEQGLKLVDSGFGSVYLSSLRAMGNGVESTTASPAFAAWLALGKAEALAALGADLDQAITLLETSLNFAESRGDNELAAQCYLIFGRIYAHKLETKKAELALDTGMEIVTSQKLSPELERAFLTRTIAVELSRGEIAGALSLQERLVELYRKEGDIDRYFSARNNRSLIYYLNNKVGRALADVEGVMTESAKAKRQLSLAYSNLFAGMINSDLSKTRKAELYLSTAVDLFASLSVMSMLLLSYAEKAIVETLSGKQDDAKETLERAVEIRDKTQSRTAQGQLELALGLAASRVGQKEEGNRHMDLAQKALANDAPFLVRMLWIRGLEEYRWGDRRLAADHLGRARTIAKAAGMRRYVHLTEPNTR
jgi:ATP/maltotriose-dependent transcriptional regulator MalT